MSRIVFVSSSVLNKFGSMINIIIIIIIIIISKSYYSARIYQARYSRR